MARVCIKNGIHAGKAVKNQTFELVRPLSVGNRGPFLMVNGLGVHGFPQRNFKIFVQKENDFQITGPDAAAFLQPKVSRVRDKLTGKALELNGRSILEHADIETDETDEEIRNRLAERFEIMERMVMATARGTIKGLIISGAPGVGKSFGVEHALGRDSLMDKLAFDADDADQDGRRVARDGTFKPRYNIVSGYATPPALYRQLYEYSEEREILVFDDCDNILFDDQAVLILKAALNTSGKRVISWLNNSRAGDGVPNQFEFKGSVIFITNIDFETTAIRSAKLAPHLEAMMDRCMYLDLTIKSKRDKLIRINHVCRDLKMLENKGLDEQQIEEVLDFVHDRASEFSRLSLRKVDHLADLRLSSKHWRREAEVMLLRQRR